MRSVMWMMVMLGAGCAAETGSVVPVECDGADVVCDGDAVCEGEDAQGDGPAYVVCPRSGAPVCRQRIGIGLVDAERPEMTPICVR